VRWQGQRQSENIEDRRGLGPASIGGVGGLGIGGIVLVLAVSYFTGVNPLTLIDMMSGLQSTTEAPIDTVPTGPVKDEIGRFASVVLADTEDTWQQLLP
jgi:predicted metalloprotease